MEYQIKKKIYLDDVRTPVNDPKFPESEWTLVRSYSEFVQRVEEIGLDNISIISLDHDLGPSAMTEYHNHVSPHYELDYSRITEKTGYDCAKWLVERFYEKNPRYLNLARVIKKEKDFPFPTVYVHSANPIGSANIMGYINNFLMNEGQPQTCVRVRINHV
jgi:hypothetical protein